MSNQRSYSLSANDKNSYCYLFYDIFSLVVTFYAEIKVNCRRSGPKMLFHFGTKISLGPPNAILILYLSVSHYTYVSL